MIYESFSMFASKIYCFTSFVNSAQGFPQPLSKEEEKECFAQMQKGDKTARDKLISHNLRLVAHIVKKFSNSLEADDLISVGTIGLIKAVDNFDYSKGAQLSTYASRCIENEILMLIRANKRHRDTISLSSPCRAKNDENDIELEEVLSISEDDEVLNEVERNCMMDSVNQMMNKYLSSMERDIIRKRYGLDGKDPMTQREIAAEYKLSRSYISRIETKALKVLQDKMVEQEMDS